MKRTKEEKVFFEYRVILDQDQNQQLAEYVKQFGASVTGTLRSALRLLFETENQKNQAYQQYLNGQKIMKIENEN